MSLLVFVWNLVLFIFFSDGKNWLKPFGMQNMILTLTFFYICISSYFYINGPVTFCYTNCFNDLKDIIFGSFTFLGSLVLFETQKILWLCFHPFLWNLQKFSVTNNFFCFQGHRSSSNFSNMGNKLSNWHLGCYYTHRLHIYYHSFLWLI